MWCYQPFTFFPSSSDCSRCLRTLIILGLFTHPIRAFARKHSAHASPFCIPAYNALAAQCVGNCLVALLCGGPAGITPRQGWGFLYRR